MGISVGGETFRGFREQSLRISACTLKFFWDGENADVFEKGGIVKRGLIFHDDLGDDRQGTLWNDVVQLDETFFQALRDHPVPLLEEAVRQLKDRSLSLDLYVWLAYRLHSLSRPQPISWPSLYAQFGAGYDQMKHFKPRFVQALQYALAAYPDAKVEPADDGVVLHPSRPPIAPPAGVRAWGRRGGVGLSDRGGEAKASIAPSLTLPRWAGEGIGAFSARVGSPSPAQRGRLGGGLTLTLHAPVAFPHTLTNAWPRH